MSHRGNIRLDLPLRRARRPALITMAGLAALALWLAFPWLERSFLVGSLEFTPLEAPAGFRQISGAGPLSGGAGLLVGIGGGKGASRHDAPGNGALCRALFGPAPLVPHVVPIAFFTDYRCPYCRVLSESLASLAGRTPPGIRIEWHEWPILGPSSELAARGALAARQQGAYAAFHERLNRTSFIPTPAWLRSVAGSIGIDAERLIADMQGAAVDEQLAETRGLARLFGFRGTPGLIVGRTVVSGAISEARLRVLIERERADGPVPACRNG